MCASSAPVFPLAEILVSFSYDAGGGDDYDGGVFFFFLASMGVSIMSVLAHPADASRAPVFPLACGNTWKI